MPVEWIDALLVMPGIDSHDDFKTTMYAFRGMPSKSYDLSTAYSGRGESGYFYNRWSYSESNNSITLVASEYGTINNLANCTSYIYYR